MTNLIMSVQIFKRASTHFQMWLFLKDLAETLKFEITLEGSTKKVLHGGMNSNKESQNNHDLSRGNEETI